MSALSMAASRVSGSRRPISRILTVPLVTELSQTSPNRYVDRNRSTATDSPSCIHTRGFSSPTKKYVVVNTVGADRPGIVADVTSIVVDMGGNIGESRSQSLGGHFSSLLLVEISSKNIDALHKELETISDLDISCFDAVDPQRVDVQPKIGFSGVFKLSGADNPGIVHKLTSCFAKYSLNIETMSTTHEEAPFGGTLLFKMNGNAVAYEPLPSSFDWRKIQAEVAELGEGLNCDVDFKPVSEARTLP